MVGKEVCKQPCPFDRQNYSNNTLFLFKKYSSIHFSLSFSLVLVRSHFPSGFFFPSVQSQGMEQYPPHALPPPCCWSPRRTFWPWFSLSQSPGVWRIFSTSSSKAHWTPSLVFALASVQRKPRFMRSAKKSSFQNVTKRKKNPYTSAFKSKTEQNLFYNTVKLMIEISKYPRVDKHDI